MEATQHGGTSKRPTGFFDLPAEIRDEIYKLVLICPQSISLNAFSLRQPRPRPHMTSIVLANTTTNKEATPILYGQNFFFTGRSEDFAEFLNLTGPANAKLLRHLSIIFPDFDVDSDNTNLRLRNHSHGVRVLDLIREKCPGVVTLKMHFPATFEALLLPWPIPMPVPVPKVDEALALVNGKFRAIPSLKEVRMEVYAIATLPSMCEKLKALGWILKVHAPRDVDTELWELNGSSSSSDFDDSASDTST